MHWYGPHKSIPIAVVALDNKSTAYVHLIHRCFVQRYNIRKGVQLITSSDHRIVKGTVYRGAQSSMSVYPLVMTDHILTKWIVFKRGLQPLIGYNLCKKLFMGGYHTLSSVYNERDYAKFRSIRGIGPKSTQTIKEKSQLLYHEK
jgi:hypothetical protein